jgi:hypothetical protein
MRCWAVTVSEERFAGERLYAFDTLTIPDAVSGAASPAAPAPGDVAVLLIAEHPVRLFGLGTVAAGHHVAVAGDLVIVYTHRLFDEPVGVCDILAEPARPGVRQLSPDTYAQLASRSGPVRTDPHRREWFVSVSLPIEASSSAEAVREFWTYLTKLGPRELPAYVWPRNDELAMRAYVLGDEANQDPEED